jgi:formylglycine-generating enzyme required for sulfatase activity
MTYFRARGILNITATLLLFLLIPGDLLFSRRIVNNHDPGENDLHGLFRWTIKEYNEGHYWEAASNLELLLTYFDEENWPEGGDANSRGSSTEKKEKLMMKGKICLLLGASYERIGNREKSRKYYLEAKEILEVPVIDGVDFVSLKGYQLIIMRKLRTPKPGIIEKPAVQQNMEKKTVFYIVMAAAVTAAIVAILLKKNDNASAKFDAPEVDPDFDTSELGIQWALIPPGEFTMGDTFGEGENDELPVHNVYLSTYYISKHEITFNQYERFCDEANREKPSDNGWGRGNRPVINVTWSQAKAFCQWLSEKTDKNIILPTEAQWEKAAKGPENLRYPWGNEPPSHNTSNHGFNFYTLPVGSFVDGVSYYGVYDMGGNVAEWCEDLYTSTFYAESLKNNPINLTSSAQEAYMECVIRGGSWDVDQTSVRCADRWHGTHIKEDGTAPSIHNAKSPAIGFRIVWQGERTK